MILLLIYWLITTIYGTYWLVKNPSARNYDDTQYVSLLDILGYFLFAAFIAWIIVPMMLLVAIKFKR